MLSPLEGILDEIDEEDPTEPCKNWRAIARSHKGSLLERAVNQVKVLESKPITENLEEKKDQIKFLTHLAIQ